MIPFIDQTTEAKAEVEAALTKAFNDLIEQVPFWERGVAEQAIPPIVAALPGELAKIGFKIVKA